MNEPDPIEDILSKHRRAEASPGLRERVLEAALDAWAEAEPAGTQVARPLPGLERSPWWQFAAAAALVLFAGLNLIQSAGNLTAAQPFESAPAERRAESSLSQLKQAFYLEPMNDHE